MMNPLLNFVQENATPSGCVVTCEFGELRCVYRFQNPIDNGCVTTRDRGCSDKFEIIIEIQPLEEETMLKREGHVSKTMYRFWYSPQYSVNATAFNGEPFYLTGSDSKFVVGSFDSKQIQHSDLIEYLGGKYMICSLSNWTGEDCDCPLDTGDELITLQEGIMEYWNDQFHEREATIENDTFQETGEIWSGANL